MNRLLSFTVLSVVIGFAMSKQMTKEDYELMWEAITKLSTPLYGDDGNVDVAKLGSFADSALDHIKDYEHKPHEGPLWDLYNQLGIESTELGTCLNGFKESKFQMMKWMGVAMFSGLKCQIAQFKDSFLQQDCAKESMKECVPVMLSKAIKAKKMAWKVKKAAKMVSLTCSTEKTSENTIDGMFAAVGAPPPTEHHIKGPFCMMAAFTKMMDADNEKAICNCMEAEFERQEMPISKEMIQMKLRWFQEVATTLASADPTGALPSLPALPEEMKAYDPFYAAECVVQHCNGAQIAGILKMTGLMDAMQEMNKIKEFFGDEMLDMVQKKCRCMQSNFATAPMFVDNPGFCDDEEALRNILGMGSNPVEQDKQCTGYIVDMLAAKLENMGDE